jgi:hypothetical protein
MLLHVPLAVIQAATNIKYRSPSLISMISTRSTESLVPHGHTLRHCFRCPMICQSYQRRVQRTSFLTEAIPSGLNWLRRHHYNPRIGCGHGLDDFFSFH